MSETRMFWCSLSGDVSVVIIFYLFHSWQEHRLHPQFWSTPMASLAGEVTISTYLDLQPAAAMAPPLRTRSGGGANAKYCELLPKLQPPAEMAPPLRTETSGGANAIYRKILPEEQPLTAINLRWGPEQAAKQIRHIANYFPNPVCEFLIRIVPP